MPPHCCPAHAQVNPFLHPETDLQLCPAKLSLCAFAEVLSEQACVGPGARQAQDCGLPWLRPPERSDTKGSVRRTHDNSCKEGQGIV